MSSCDNCHTSKHKTYAFECFDVEQHDVVGLRLCRRCTDIWMDYLRSDPRYISILDAMRNKNHKKTIERIRLSIAKPARKIQSTNRDNRDINVTQFKMDSMHYMESGGTEGYRFMTTENWQKENE